MAFPQTPRDTRVELFVNGNWVDVTSDVYARDGVTITRGGRDETSRVEPSSCRFTLNNRTGKYSPRNPNGPYFGSIGRNTPLRISVGKDTDTFTRTVSSGWGATDLGSTWSTFGFGGTVAASDFNVGSGVGTHSVPARDALRATYIGGQTYKDVDVAVTCSLSLASITGGSIQPANIMLRGIDANNYIFVNVYAWIDGFYWIDIYESVGGVFTSLNTDHSTGVPYVSGQQVRVRANVEGPFVRAKLWVSGTSEPYGWNNIAVSAITNTGWVGVKSGVQLANTNALPVIFTYDDFVVRVPRYAGEVSYWPQRWDTSGRDVYVPTEAAGIKRRLGQGTAPVKSAMVDSVTSLAIPPVIYWPGEDGAQGTQISALIGGNPMRVKGTTTFASFNGFACSQPLPTLGASTWSGRVPAYSSSGTVSLRFLLHISTSEPPDNTVIAQLFTTGTASLYEVLYRTGGRVTTRVWSSSGANLFTSGIVVLFDGSSLMDNLYMFDLHVVTNGANIDMSSLQLKVGQTLATTRTDTITSRTVGMATQVVIDPAALLRDATIGHITVRNEYFSIFDTAPGLNAYSGAVEIGGGTAVDRLTRLTAASAGSVPFYWVGDGSGTAMVGPQRPLPLLTLLEEAADADMGVLHEVRGDFGLLYRARATMYNQAAALTLDYSAGQVSPPLEPVDDDALTRNDVIVKRTDGGSFEIFLSSGRLSVADPWSGGVGTYQDQPTLNVNYDSQLPDAAGWRLLLGTVDEARYPTITLNLANQSVVAAGLDNAAMSVEVGDRIVVTNPPVFSTPDPISQIVRGYTETLNVFEHRITFVCAPASPYEVLRAGVSGKMTLDNDASTLASSVTTTGTSFTVATPAGSALWVTGPVSFDLMMDGERITVTNIGGTSSPQTFTVVRSVNGVVKTHSAGSAVRLLRPSVLGL